MLIGISDQMGEKTDRLRCEVCQTLILSPINTGFLRPTVATVLTVHGIETLISSCVFPVSTLQQCLPFTVLKLVIHQITIKFVASFVATVLTVHGIETCRVKLTPNLHKDRCNSAYHLRYAPKGARQQRRKATMRPTHCKYLNEEKVKQS